MHTFRQMRIAVYQISVLAILLASANVSAQVVNIGSILAVPIPLWADGLIIMLLAGTGYWVLRNRLPSQIAHLRSWLLIVLVSASSLAVIASGSFIDRAYASICSACNFSITDTRNTFGPVDWDTDVTITNALNHQFTVDCVTTTCPSYAPCNLSTPDSAPTTPQCVPGLKLNPGGVCVVRVVTTAGFAILPNGGFAVLSSDATDCPSLPSVDVNNNYLSVNPTSNALTGTGSNPAWALNRYQPVQNNNNNWTLQSIGTGKYLKDHPALGGNSIPLLDSNNQPYSIISADGTGPDDAAELAIFVGDANQAFILKAGSVGADIDLLRFDSCNKKIYFVHTNTAAAISDSASFFNIVVQ